MFISIQPYVLSKIMTVGLLGLRSVATPKHYLIEECRIGTFHDSGLTTAVVRICPKN